MFGEYRFSCSTEGRAGANNAEDLLDTDIIHFAQ